MTTYSQTLKDASQVCKMMSQRLKKDVTNQASINRAEYAEDLLTIVSKAILELEPGFVNEFSELPTSKGL